MKYLDIINEQIRSVVEKTDNLVLFGQNISAGSCLGGLTKNLCVKTSSKIINSTNSENSLCGFGFGMMMNNVSSVFFMKQLDFLLLGIDHLVNTYNIIRNMKKDLQSSFTIIPIIVDNGFQGPQSSFNNFGDICSMARIEGRTISTKFEAEKIISENICAPGFRIIGVSQRMFKDDIIELNPLTTNSDYSLIRYTKGENATIVCFNFSLKLGLELLENEFQKLCVRWSTVVPKTQKLIEKEALNPNETLSRVTQNRIAREYFRTELFQKGRHWFILE